MEMVKILDEPDFQGITPFEYAKLSERPEILDMLEKIRAGVKVEIPNFKNEEEEEPIHINVAQISALKQ